MQEIEFNIIPITFKDVQKVYPRKGNSASALVAWNKAIQRKDFPLNQILGIIEKHTIANNWHLKKNQKYIPYLSTWLNQKRYQDEVIIPEQPIEIKEPFGFFRENTPGAEYELTQAYALFCALYKFDETGEILGILLSTYKWYKKLQPPIAELNYQVDNETKTEHHKVMMVYTPGVFLKKYLTWLTAQTWITRPSFDMFEPGNKILRNFFIDQYTNVCKNDIISGEPTQNCLYFTKYGI